MLGLMQDWPLLCHRIIDHAAHNHAGRPIITRSIEALISGPGWQRQLAEEGELLMRLLTRSDAGFQPRFIAAYRDLLAEEADAGRLELRADLDELAYGLVRITESYVYREFITGDEPDADGAGQLLRLLLR